MTAQIYRDLHMPAAAKHVALGAARIAGRDLPEHYAWACFKAAEADYHQGAWFGSTQITRAGMAAHLLLAEDAQNLERHSHLSSVYFELAVVRGLARAADGDYREFLDGVLDEFGLGEYLDALLRAAPERPWWETKSSTELYDHAVGDLGHPPFSDGGSRRTISWRALGVSWSVEFENDYASTVLGERLAAYAQVVLVDLAQRDPVLLPTSVTFVVYPADPDTSVEVESRSDGTSTTWLVRMPAAGEDNAESVKKIAFDTMTAIMSAIAEVSLLDQQSMARLLTEASDDGLLDKLAFGTAYDFAYSGLISAAAFDRAPRSSCPPLYGTDDHAMPHEADELRAERPGPGYDETSSAMLVEKRYRMVEKALVATLPALQENTNFRSLATKLTNEGWKEWHILLAVLNVAQNHRISVAGLQHDDPNVQRHLQQAESPDDPAPLELFHEQALRDALRTSWLATINGLGLTFNHPSPDLAAVERLLATRYAYWDHDVDHSPYF